MNRLNALYIFLFNRILAQGLLFKSREGSYLSCLVGIVVGSKTEDAVLFELVKKLICRTSEDQLFPL